MARQARTSSNRMHDVWRPVCLRVFLLAIVCRWTSATQLDHHSPPDRAAVVMKDSRFFYCLNKNKNCAARAYIPTTYWLDVSDGERWLAQFFLYRKRTEWGKMCIFHFPASLRVFAERRSSFEQKKKHRRGECMHENVLHRSMHAAGFCYTSAVLIEFLGEEVEISVPRILDWVFYVFLKKKHYILT